MHLGGSPLKINAVPGEFDAERWSDRNLGETSTSHECSRTPLRPSRSVLPFEPTEHQTIDDLAPADGEDDQYRQAGNDGHGQHLDIVRGIERAELGEAQWDSVHVIALDDNQGPE